MAGMAGVVDPGLSGGSQVAAQRRIRLGHLGQVSLRQHGLRGDIQRSERDIGTAGQHLPGRFRIQAEIGVLDVTLDVEHPTHNHDFLHRLRHLRVQLQGMGDVGQRADCCQGYLAGVIADQLADRYGGVGGGYCGGLGIRRITPQGG
ncbi:hypothetical protein D3C73_1055020 [compost metagenome]